MDQIITGKFISAERKRKGLTQKQLAEKLNISDKTISKWECGNGFPEVSLLLPLCEVLEITVNELLAGEHISEKEYRKKAEENMMDMIKEKEENKKLITLTTVTGIISTAAFLTLILVVCAYTNVISVPVKIVLVVIACVIFGLGLCVAMHGERTVGYYKCRHCGEYFVPTYKSYIFGIHFIFHRWLKCPKCGKSGYCRKVLSKKD